MRIDSDKKTASQICMDALEDFSRSEPDTIVMVYLNDANEIVVKTNDMDYIQIAGIGCYLQDVALRRMRVD